MVARAAFTAGEILSAFASNTLTCQICVSLSVSLNAGMPVKRIPFFAFQYVSHAGSSVTPLPLKSSGGLGNMPFAILLLPSPGDPCVQRTVGELLLKQHGWIPDRDRRPSRREVKPSACRHQQHADQYPDKKRFEHDPVFSLNLSASCDSHSKFLSSPRLEHARNAR